MNFRHSCSKIFHTFSTLAMCLLQTNIGFVLNKHFWGCMDPCITHRIHVCYIYLHLHIPHIDDMGMSLYVHICFTFGSHLWEQVLPGKSMFVKLTGAQWDNTQLSQMMISKGDLPMVESKKTTTYKNPRKVLCLEEWDQLTKYHHPLDEHIRIAAPETSIDFRLVHLR